jgi:hypothetical protein
MVFARWACCPGSAGGGYLFVKLGGVPMATSSKPLPVKAMLARMALHASTVPAAKLKNPLPSTKGNLAGAHDFKSAVPLS